MLRSGAVHLNTQIAFLVLLRVLPVIATDADITLSIFQVHIGGHLIRHIFNRQRMHGARRGNMENNRIFIAFFYQNILVKLDGIIAGIGNISLCNLNTFL